MDLGLKGKTVIITGGSGGIGQGLVLEFAREGCNVICAARDKATGDKLALKAEQAGLPGKILAIATDITQRASVDAMVGEAERQFGGVDVLVNNAGGGHSMVNLAGITEEARRWEVALNIDGLVNCCKAVYPGMVERGHGNIINISSNGALDGETGAHIAHYSACKGFMNSLTRSMAWDWAQHGIRANTIAPGWIVPHHAEDVGSGSFWTKFGFEQIGSLEQMEQRLAEGTLPGVTRLPIKRLGRPEDIANLAMFLASEVSSYITGQLISVSGGNYMP